VTAAESCREFLQVISCRRDRGIKGRHRQEGTTSNPRNQQQQDGARGRAKKQDRVCQVSDTGALKGELHVRSISQDEVGRVVQMDRGDCVGKERNKPSRARSPSGEQAGAGGGGAAGGRLVQGSTEEGKRPGLARSSLPMIPEKGTLSRHHA
jgi:hypothetical protein